MQKNYEIESCHYCEWTMRDCIRQCSSSIVNN